MWRYFYAHTLVLLVAATIASAAPAKPQQQAGTLGRHRLIYRFDFEEADQNNFEDLPRHWYVIGRHADTGNRNFLQHALHADLVNAVGFPRYTQVRFNKSQHEQGNHTLYLGLNSGNAGAFVEIGTLPAVPTSDYLITASIKTETLQQAGAQLSAYFVDTLGKRIESSIAKTDLIRSDGHWQTVAVKLHGEHPEAAWIGLQVEVRQPTFNPESPLGDRQVVYRQVTGSAWVDDVSIWQMPRVSVTSQSPVNIIRGPKTPRLTMQVRDLTGRALHCKVLLFDHTLKQVAEHERSLGEGAPIKWKWDPPLDRYGWYMVQMIVTEPPSASSPGALIAKTMSVLLWLPEEPALDTDDENRFKIAAQDVSERYLKLLPQLLEGADLRSSVVSIWDRSTKRAGVSARQERLDGLIQNLLGRGWQVGMSLYPLPDELAVELDLDASSALAALQNPQDKWQAYVSPALMRHGQRIRRWYLGSAEYANAFYNEQLAPLVEAIEQEFSNTAPHPQLILPWKISQSKPDIPMRAASYAIHVPTGVRPETITAHTKDWQQSPTTPFDLHLAVPLATELEHEQRIQDLTLRMLYSWDTGAQALAINHPWTRGAGRDTTLLPDPLLGVFSQIAHRLAGRRMVGWLPLRRGMKCMIFNGQRGGMLAAWNESANPSNATIDMYLGDQPTVIDVWGNRKTVELTEQRHRVTLGPTPIFIEGIDAELALFRASFEIDPPFIESTLSPHRRTLRLTNPWPRTISGNFLIDNPPTWQISPKRHHFSIASGETAELLVDLQFPVYEVAGHKRIAASFDFIANNRYKVDISTDMELGLANVDLDATLTIERNTQTGEQDAVVTQLISNTGSDETIALYAFASLPGHPRQERIVAQLKPGQTILRRFRFTDAYQQIKTTPIRVGVRQTTGPAVLNKILSADDL